MLAFLVSEGAEVFKFAAESYPILALTADCINIVCMATVRPYSADLPAAVLCVAWPPFRQPLLNCVGVSSHVNNKRAARND